MKLPSYEKVDLNQYCEDQLENLTPNQRSQVLEMLTSVKDLFSGGRGHYKGPPVDLKLKEGAKLTRAKPYPVPLKNREVMKKELQRQCDIGAIKRLTPKEAED